MQGLAMKGLTVAVFFWTLISPSSGSKAWPTHTVCRNGNLEVLYQSCDPLQDFGFSVDQCSKHLKSNLNIRFGLILREDIKELFLDIALFTKGSSILNFSYPICEEDLPKFSFCGRRKGEQIYYAGPINNPGFEILPDRLCLQGLHGLKSLGCGMSVRLAVQRKEETCKQPCRLIGSQIPALHYYSWLPQVNKMSPPGPFTGKSHS
ncbi:lymphocyte antigen 86 isoform X1 [Mustela putorius furo]|uniref:Lymphocyte antigen 86 isoform X1 n=1 Tax=Mustela putorius furo TaxID=9669 RepID=A0A8U0RGQ9_MUSPF|nr:lymphocyte antigen 86 isoform X1 [Mustela putorius furo]